MDLIEEIQNIVGKPESQTLEYKAVLPPSRNVAQIIHLTLGHRSNGRLLLCRPILQCSAMRKDSS